MKLHLFCSPRIVWSDGADHIGIDASLRCAGCGRRTVRHVECLGVNPEVRRILRKEWSRLTTRASLQQEPKP